MKLKKVEISFDFFSECNLKNLDIMYVFDSYAMGQKKTNLILDSVADLIRLSNRETDSIRSGVLMKSCHNHQDVPLDFYADEKEFRTSVAGIHTKGLSSLLKKLRHHAYQIQNGGRQEAQNVAVIFIDGGMTNFKEIQMEVKRVKFRNQIEVFVVLIGGERVDYQFETLCSEPAANHLITVPSYTALNSLRSVLFPKFCSGMYAG